MHSARKQALALFVLLLAFLASTAYAAGGTFLGKTLTRFPLGWDGATRVANAPDNGIILFGTAQHGTKQVALLKFLPDGRIDTSFGPNHDGQSILTVDGDAHVWGIGWDSNAKYLVAGDVQQNLATDPGHMLVARFNLDGTPDTTFGNGKGYVTIAAGSGFPHAYAVTTDSNHRVIVGGSSRGSQGDAAITIVRLNQDGSIDKTFGTNGFHYEADNGFGETAHSILWNPAGGTITVAGEGVTSPGAYTPVLRLTDSGALDPTFGTNGRVNVQGTNGGGWDMVNDSANNLLIATDTFNRTDVNHQFVQMAAIRLTANGAPDTTFGTNGISAPVPAANSAYSYGLAWDADGHIVLSGSEYYATPSTTSQYAVIGRLNGDGTLDTTFGSGGVKKVTVGPETLGYGLAKLGSGSYAVAGTTSVEGYNMMALVFTHAGAMDTTFNATGERDYDIGAKEAHGNASALQSDGMVVVAGTVVTATVGGTAPPTTSGVIARYRTDGTLDPAFGSGGSVFVSPVLASVAIQPDGKIVAAGYTLQNQGGTNVPVMALVRLNANGTPDTTFGPSGVLVLSSSSSEEELSAVTVLSDGRIVGAGHNISGTDMSSLFVRLLPSGAFDTTFGGTGEVVYNVNPGDTDLVNSLAIQPDGKIVAAGWGWHVSYDDIMVVRLNTDGTVDTSFHGGAVFIDFNHQSSAAAVTLSGDGHVLVGGAVDNTSDFDFALARLNADGTLDSSFGNGNGLAQYNFDGNDRIRALRFSPSGVLTAAGETGGNFALAQFNANGSLKTDFGTNGLVSQKMNAGADVATGLQFESDGTIFESGDASGMFGLARFTGDSGTATLTPTTTSLTSNQNPVHSSTTVGYTAVVSSSLGTPDGTVTFLDNGTAMCSNVALTNGSATCYQNMVAIGDHTITASYNGTATYATSSATLTETVNSNFCVTNLASASAGAVATASSQYGAGFPVAAVNDGECAGRNWANGGGWADGTVDQYPDWVQVQFTGPKLVDQVVVYTLQDDWQSPVDPTGGETFTKYGIVDFNVEYWDGAQWQTAAIVANNNLVMRVIRFSTPFDTDRIRIKVLRAMGQLSRIVEVEAMGQDGPPLNPPQSSNVALASAGATATASSTYGSGFAPSGAIDGDRSGANWTQGGGWADGTVNQYPDWLQVDFSGPQTIDHVVVTTLQDNWQNPSQPTDTMTFTQYGIVDFTVQGWNGTSWIDLASVTGNNLVMRTVSFTPVSTDRIRVLVTRALNSLSRITEVEAWTTSSTASQGENDVALASLGTVASASSTYNANFPVSAINDNERAGTHWSQGGGWADATPDQYPDWVQLDFPAPQTLDKVVVYTLQDNWQNPSEPTDTMTFTQYGITDFTVQAWNGTQWVTLATVAGNNLVKRTVTFPATTTSKIRVNVTHALNSLSRITEVEAWGFPAGSGSGETNFALGSNGATAGGSSRYCNDCWLPFNAIDGDRTGAGWANYQGGWADGTPGVYPDTLTVQLSATHTIDHVTVYTLQDNYQSPVEPTDTMTFSQYGIQDFQVQGWNGSQWVTLGTVTGNNLVKRDVAFAPFSTNQVRVVVTRSLGDYTRIVELEAWGH